ncbi:hypothetical protein JXA63_05535 [Candidatus Woesebacteria bacterium]|nr:hypothetical protein [Candidatus Woesebacteria bacterium]
MKEKNTVSLRQLAKTFNIPMDVARALGKNALLSQVGDILGHTSTRCDDCQTAVQYTGDLERDFGEDIKSLSSKIK